MKYTKKYTLTCASLFVGAALMAWETGPSDSELTTVNNPSGYLGNNTITTGDYVGDIGLFLSGSIPNPLYIGLNGADTTSNIWLKLTEANSSNGRLFIGSNSATTGDINAQIGGESGKTVNIGRIIGGGDSSTTGNITLDVGGNGSTVNVQRVYIAGTQNSGGNISSKDVALNLNSGVTATQIVAAAQNWATVAGKSTSIDSVALNINGATITNTVENEGVYGGVHVNTQSNFTQGASGTINNGVKINVDNGSKISAILVGGGYATNKDAVSTVNGGTEINIDGADTELSKVYGGGQGSFNSSGTTSGAKAVVTGGSVINVKNGTVYSVTGGGFAQASSLSTIDKTEVNVSGGTVYHVYGGGYGAYNGFSTVGTEGSTDTVSTVNISDNAVIYNDVVGGSLTFSSIIDLGTKVSGNTEVNIKGGNVFGNVVGSSATSYFGDGESVTGKTAAALHEGDSTVNVSGGAISQNVYGGGYAIPDDDNSSRITTTGNTTVNLTGGLVSGNVYGGGYGDGTVVNGNSTVNISDTASVSGTIYGGGENGATVEGSKTMNIGTATSGYNGNVKVADFDKINIQGGSVSTIENNMSGVVVDKEYTQTTTLKGALVNVDSTSTAKFENSNFNDNSVRLYVNNIDQNFASIVEGGIVAVDNVAEFKNTNFKANTIKADAYVKEAGSNVKGGIISVSDNANIKIESSVFEGNVVDSKSNSAYAAIYGGIININNGAVATLTDTKFTKNNISTTDSYGPVFGGVIRTLGDTTLSNVVIDSNSLNTSGKSSSYFGSLIDVANGTTNISGSTFSNNDVVANQTNPMINGAIFVGKEDNSTSESQTLNVDNSTFTGNTGTSSYGANGVAIYVSGTTATANISNSSFENNKAVAGSYKSRGGAVANYQGVMSLTDVSFVGNLAESATLDYAQGGALYNRSYSAGASTTLTDVSFTNNTAKNGMGGAIFTEGGAISINATKDIVSTGNKALDSESVASDSRGGFLYMVNYGGTNAPTVNFNVSDGATLTIGNGTANEDSIVSKDSTAIINKTGTGSIIVNSSMEYYTGALNVSEGDFVLANKLGAATVSGDITALISGANSSKTNDTTSIFNGTSFADGANVNVGFDVSKDVSIILGSTTNVYSDATGKPTVTFAGKDGVYSFTDKANQIQNLSYTVTDGNKVVIANTLGIYNASTGASATISKDADTTTLQVTNGTVQVAQGTTQTVDQVKTDEGTSLAISGGELKASSVADNSKIVIEDGIAEIATVADSATVEVSGGTLKTESVDLTLGGIGTNSTLQVSGGVVESSNSMNLISDITVAENKSLEIKSALSVANDVSLVASTPTSIIKLQNDVTLSGVNTKLVLDGNVKGAANFSGVDGASQKIEFTSTFGPGNSPAISSFKDVTADFTKTTSVLNMEIFSSVNLTAGASFDQVALRNANLDFGNNGKLEISIDKMEGFDFKAGSFEYQLFDVDGTSTITGLTAGNVTIVLSDAIAQEYNVMFTNDGGSSMSSVISQSALDSLIANGSVSLTFEAIPEPSQIASLIGIISLLCAIYRRRNANRA